MLAMLLALATLAAAQLVSATVRGKVTDEQGQPIANAILRFQNPETGRKYDLKTNAKGEYIQVGMQLGRYDCTLIGPDGKQLFSLHGVKADPSNDTVVDIDLRKERQEQSAAPPATPGNAQGKQPAAALPVATKQQKEEMAKIDQENLKIRSLNQMLTQAEAAKTANNLEQAISLMQQATTQAPDKELLWTKLAEYSSAAGKWSDAIEPYQKAIALISAEPPEKQNKAQLAALHNNLGQAFGKTGKPQDAIREYTTAAQVNPASAAQYYFNLGAVLTNHNHPDDANAAFDKAIATDPNYADAYYQKGVNLLQKATVGKDGKMTAPEGTSDALNKYLQLQPTGKYAEGAKQLLATIGAEVETGYKSTKSSKKPR
ncbi:MAG: tetratricopeptide repeat protein [Acidobacteriota bacterium]|nr:tetratricopeptide repeat protein [Acidobacteriota bacterium]